jgi:hypothetical protein
VIPENFWITNGAPGFCWERFFMAKLLLGIDIGTSATKAVLVDAEDGGRVLAVAASPHGHSTPKPGRLVGGFLRRDETGVACCKGAGGRCRGDRALRADARERVSRRKIT